MTENRPEWNPGAVERADRLRERFAPYQPAPLTWEEACEEKLHDLAVQISPDGARLNRGITSTEAGRIMHAHRGSCAKTGAKWDKWAGRPGTAACCPYAAEDGRAALVRLMKRGLVRRTKIRGKWRIVRRRK